MQKETVLLIHGLGATGRDHCFPWLEKSLPELGYDVINPDFPKKLADKLAN